MTRRAATQARVSAVTLLAFTFAATLILALSFIATRERIAANENAARAALIAQTLPRAVSTTTWSPTPSR